MAGRPKIFDETNALNKATILFWKKGYEATSTEDLINAMGLQRGSFYHTFKSKKELYIKALNFHETNSFDEFEKILKNSNRPIETLKSTFLELVNCSDEEHKMGCFAGNTLAELSGIDEEIVEKAKMHLKRLESIMTKQIKISQASGELKTTVDAKIIGRSLLNLWNGLNITRRIYNDKRILQEIISLQLELIK